MQYVEILKNCCNAVDGTFYDAINLRDVGPRKWRESLLWLPEVEPRKNDQ